MKLEHIAISITNKNEIESFYKNILGFEEIRVFTINKDLASEIFGINEDTSVCLLQKENLTIEIFVTEAKVKQGFNHICIKIKERDEIFKKSEAEGYKCIRKKRDKSDLVFIFDKSGNVFEIKEL